VLLYATAADAVAAHRAGGGRAVLALDGRVRLCDGGAETALPLRAPAASGGAALPMPMSLLLPAVAAGWACGLAPALIAAALDTYVVPGAAA
jgi:cyanophycin synthetase